MKNKLVIPPGYVACGTTAIVEGPAGGEPTSKRTVILLAHEDSEIENPHEDPEAVAIEMTVDTMQSLKAYLDA
jgi:hypothetical protein